MIPSKIRAVLLCAALAAPAACTDKPAQIAKLEEALPNLPLPPEPSFVSRQGSPDALQITVRSPAPVDQVTAYYRRMLTSGRWHLVSDAKDAGGAIVLLAEQKGPPLWVRIQAAHDGGSVVQLAGAVLSEADSAASPRGRKS